MKRETGEVYCDKCHSEITPQEELRGEALHYRKTDYHVGCYTYLRRQTEPGQRIVFDEFRAVALVLFALSLIAAFAPAEVPPW